MADPLRSSAEPELFAESLRRGFTMAHRTTRVVFGEGSVTRIREHVVTSGITRAVVITTPSRAPEAEHILDLLGPFAAGVCPIAQPHVGEAAIKQANDHLSALKADGCVAFGGGSSIGLAKALALSCAMPFVAIPTTYSGSEMTAIWGITTEAGKETGRAEKVRARAVIYDPSLLRQLKFRIRLVSGINALAHAVEALYAPGAGPVVTAWALDAAERIVSALSVLHSDPTDWSTHLDALYAACVAGMCLDSAPMGLHHKICHVLGGTLGLPHAATHAVVLPHVIAFMAPAVPTEISALAERLGGDPAQRIQKFVLSKGGPTSLSELGMTTAHTAAVCEALLAAQYPSRRTPGPREAIALLDACLNGVSLIA